MDPSAKREQDERRLTGLKVGAVAITVAGLGVFAGLAAAGTDDSPAPVSAVSPGAAAEDDSFFDDQAQSAAVGGYEGYAQGYDDGYAGQADLAPGGGWGASQGSTGGS